MTSTTIDYSTLNWVKEEIDETLKQARHALEEYVENQDDSTHLRFCATYIHQVYGTLQMVELYGAALFAEEMEQLVQALIDNKVSQKDDAHEVLMRAILQLPDYLERIQAGLQDNPLILMPMLNDLRSSRGDQLLSESALFAPDINSSGPVVITEHAHELIGLDPRLLARRVRPFYQVGLLGWYRDNDPKGSLKKILKALQQLEQVCTRDEVVRLWWVAAGVVEALVKEGINSSITVKLLLGHVDREIKRMIDLGESELAAKPSLELLKNLLYYVAQSVPVTDRVRDIKQKFNLGAALSSQEEIESARERLSGPNTQLMETVAAAINEDLSRVKEALDLLLRSDERDVSSLGAQLDLLGKMADTLGMLGMGVPRKVVQEQVGIIKQMISGDLEVTEPRLMDVAKALLYIESSLAGMVQSTHAAAAQVASPESIEAGQVADELTASEMRQIETAVLKEVSVEISRAKDAIVAFIDGPFDYTQLDVVPELFEHARGGMKMVNLDYPARMLEAVNRYINEHLLQGNEQPTLSDMDRVADVVSSIEYYLESIRENRPYVDRILAAAHESIESLGYKVEKPVGSVAAEPPADVPMLDEAVTSEFSTTMEMRVPEHPVDENEITQVMEDQAAPVDEPTLIMEQVELAEEVPDLEEITVQTVEEPLVESPEEVVVAEEEPAQPVEVDKGKASRQLMEDIDDDILEIFIEEAQEVLETINEHLPLWKQNLDDHETLSVLRRAFHTLKGSGRLVGAIDIGEFAWALENMLNRVLDNTIDATQPMLQLLEDATSALPFLIEGLKNNTSGEVDTQAYISRTEELIDAGKADARGPEHILVEEERETTAEADEQSVDMMDPVLYDIFSKESEGKISDVRGFLATCNAQGDSCHVNEPLIRSLHTLHGSARMAGADNIAEVAGAMERYTKILQENTSHLDAEGQAQIHKGVDTIELMLSQINQVDAVQPETADLFDKLKTLHDIELKKQDQRLREEQVSGQQKQPEEYESAEEEYDAEIVEVFLEEGAEILDASELILQRLREDPSNRSIIGELQRELHTLKGGARMSGIAAMGDLSHAIETVLTAIVEGDLEPADNLINVMQQTLDRLFNMLERTQQRMSLEPADDLLQKIEALHSGVTEEVVAPEEETVEAAAEPEVEEVVVEAAEAATEEVEEPEEMEAEDIGFPLPAEEEVEEVAEAVAELPQVVEEVEQAKPAEIPAPMPAPVVREVRAKPQVPQEQIRVSAELLDQLVNNAGEVSIYRSRLEQTNGAFRFNLVEMEQTVARLREQLRKLEIETEAQILFRYEREGVEADENFDPLEMDRYSTIQQLSRALMETTADISSIENLMDNLVRESETLLIQQARVNTDLQEGLMRTRMVSFSGMVPRLQRLVRQTCNELGKKAQLEVIGEHGEMDRTVLERITAPLEHMMRNAISHGIESPAKRRNMGKPESGTITFVIEREGSEVVLTISDDGAGMNLDAIREKAIERGLMDEKAALTDNDIMQFVLESGLSTAEEVTQISGRGVGMDVVNSEIKQLGGTLHIDSRTGLGTRFTIRMPLTLAVNHALLVSVSDESYAIPLASIEGIVRMTRDELMGYYGNPESRYHYAGNEYQVQNLSVLLNLGTVNLESAAKLFPVLLVRSGDHRTALQIDQLMGSREIVVKSVGPQLSTLRGVSGATILGDGRVVLILDIGAIIRLGSGISMLPQESVEAPRKIPGETGKISVMVVDDSITVRKVTTRLLERNDMQVLTAKDGVDAVAKLQEHIPDVMLLDIEMPRMDGFELATYMRNEERLKDVPIIMITSRTGEKHRRRAEEIGVQRYLGKPYQETELLENIHGLLKEYYGNA